MEIVYYQSYTSHPALYQTMELQLASLRDLQPNFMDDHTQQSALSPKMKSSLCRNFSAKGYCPYGPRCQFAHGLQELRCNRYESMCYKTKECFAFLKKGHCPYGNRCNFIHAETNKPKGEKTSEVNKLQTFPEIVHINGRSESRLLKLLNSSNH